MEYTTKAGQMHRGSAIRWRKRVRKAVLRSRENLGASSSYMFVLEALKRTCRIAPELRTVLFNV